MQTVIYQTQQIRQLEKLAMENGISGTELMERAGRSAFDFMCRHWSQAHKIKVFCGAGNNGGDGYVLARLAHEHGMKVTIYQVGDHAHLKDEARHAYDACRTAKVPMAPFNAQLEIQSPDLVIDALCGIGIKGNLREDFVTAIEKMQALDVPVFALDIPSGIDADTGSVSGAAVRASATITFIGLKLGLLTGSGVAYAGELICHDLRLPVSLYDNVQPVAEKIIFDQYSPYLKPRSRDWHKGLSGHVLIIGGDAGFSGAPRMAGEAALRVGAGLVSIATRPENAAEMNITCPEIMCHGVHGVNDLLPLMKKADVIVLGPGLGQSEWAKTLWACVCETTLPLVVDADALNILSMQHVIKQNWILTPHPGEAARLLQVTSQHIQQNRLAAVKDISHRYGGVCVLKGAGTLVHAQDSLTALCDKGNPGMATAGMGDVLSGVIGGLLGQHIPLFDAAKMGVCMHAIAGDMAAQDGERGTIATDLMQYLRKLANLPGE